MARCRCTESCTTEMKPGDRVVSVGFFGKPRATVEALANHFANVELAAFIQEEVARQLKAALG